MKKILCVLALLSPVVSAANTGAPAQIAYKYAGPVYFDAQQSNAGYFEMRVAYNSSVSIVLNNDDTIESTVRSCSSNSIYEEAISKDKKTVVFTSKMEIGDKSKLCSVNILTAKGLTHTLAFVASPEDFKMSDVTLKLVIK